MNTIRAFFSILEKDQGRPRNLPPPTPTPASYAPDSAVTIIGTTNALLRETNHLIYLANRKSFGWFLRNDNIGC